jgi:serine/threonine-protein kinase
MEKALQRDPAARFQSAKEMADALEQAILQRQGKEAPGTVLEPPEAAEEDISEQPTVAFVRPEHVARRCVERGAGSPDAAVSDLVPGDKGVRELESAVLMATCSSKKARRAPALVALLSVIGALMFGYGLVLLTGWTATAATRSAVMEPAAPSAGPSPGKEMTLTALTMTLPDATRAPEASTPPATSSSVKASSTNAGPATRAKPQARPAKSGVVPSRRVTPTRRGILLHR